MIELQVRIGDVMPHVIGIAEVKVLKPKSNAHQNQSALEEVGEYKMFSNIDKKGRSIILFIHMLLPRTSR